MAKYLSTKTYRQIGPVAYRQWRADSHCNLIHGYALSFHFEFECDTLDARNWCMDFGGLKDLKFKLEDWFHQIRFKKLDSNPIVAIQSNNMFDIEEHVNCVHSVDHMKKKFPMSEVLYEGELQLKGYKRFMLIGKV